MDFREELNHMILSERLYAIAAWQMLSKAAFKFISHVTAATSFIKFRWPQG
jgi:hypothetical protein